MLFLFINILLVEGEMARTGEGGRQIVSKDNVKTTAFPALQAISSPVHAQPGVLTAYFAVASEMVPRLA